MNWKRLKISLGSQALSLLGPDSTESRLLSAFDSLSHLLDFDFDNRPAIEAVLEAFFESETWPADLPPEIRAAIFVRLRVAARYPRAIAHRPSAGATWLGRRLSRLDDAALWEWLLITSWNEFGCELLSEADALGLSLRPKTGR